MESAAYPMMHQIAELKRASSLSQPEVVYLDRNGQITSQFHQTGLRYSQLTLFEHAGGNKPHVYLTNQSSGEVP